MTPKVFISATSGDLATARKAATQALLTLGCLPVVQDAFPPDTRQLRDMLREKIRQCQALIHIAGFRFGAEPAHRAPDEPRRSYTQMEFDAAVELGVQTYVFMAEESFPFDQPAGNPEDDERRNLQLAHREALRRSGRVYHVIATEGQLRERVRELQVMVDELKQQLAEQEKEMTRSKEMFNSRFKRFGRVTSAAIVLALAACAGFGLSAVQLNAKLEETNKLVAALKREREANPKSSYEASLAKVADEHQLKESQVARDFAFVEMLDAADKHSSPLLKQNAAILKPYSDLNAVIAASVLDSAEARFKPVNTAKLVLERREERRNSFSAGIGGPLRFIGDVINGLISGPPDALDQLLNNGGLIEPAAEKPRSWSTVVSKAWDDTWGVGPGNYRTGFIVGCALILVILFQAKAGR